MPDWTAPFNLPTFTNSKFDEEKAKYIAKHGYTLTIPGLSDIIKIELEQPLTFVETEFYRAKMWDEFSAGRLEDIRKMKQKRKERYLAMLASPSPQIATNVGSIMTAFDDAQDALSTMAVVGRMAMHLAPRVLGKIFAGPLSWLMTASDLLNLHRHIKCVGFPGKKGKPIVERLTDANPFTKKARVIRGARLRVILPTKGEIIEGLQTTGEVFGMGISLGPLVGLAQDMVFAMVRLQEGKPVKIDLPISFSVERVQDAWRATESFKKWSEFYKEPDYENTKRLYYAAQRTLKSMAALWMIRWDSDDELLLQSYIATYLSMQALAPVQDIYNPTPEMDRVAEIEIHAPVPTNPLTLEVIEEGGIPMKEIIGWPHDGRPWATIEEISNYAQAAATENLTQYITRHEHDWQGYTAGYLGSETALYALACIEGPEQVKYDYGMQALAIVTMLTAGYNFHPLTGPTKLQVFADHLDHLERTGYNPPMAELLQFAKDNNIILYRGRLPGM